MTTLVRVQRVSTLPIAAINDNMTLVAENPGVGVRKATVGDLRANLLASSALTGVPTAPTPAVDNSTTRIATTAWFAGQAGAAAPLMSGVAAAGTSSRWARQDHVHPTDTTRAPLDSPALTGTPTAPTQSVDNNTTRIATTAFVLAQTSSLAPTMNGTAAAGTLTRFARADHVHPTDTSRAPLASPALTGTPTAPTPSLGTNTTQIATAAAVLAEIAAGVTRMGFTQTGANAVATIVADELFNIVRPEQFGAVGNGSTDDRVAFTRAFAALAAAGGGVLRLTRGKTYVISNGGSGAIGAVVSGSNIVIEGNGATITKPAGGASMRMLDLSGTDITLRDIRFDGQNRTGGVWCLNSTRVTVQGCTFYRCRSLGQVGAEQTIIRGCFFSEGTGSLATLDDGARTRYSRGILFEGNSVVGFTSECIDINGFGRDIRIANNFFQAVTGLGFVGGSNTEMIDIGYYDRTDGVTPTNFDVTIVNNILDGAGLDCAGIRLKEGVYNVVVAGNRIMNLSTTGNLEGHGIICSTVSDHVISGNIFRSCRTGVFLSVGALRVSVLDNIFNGCLGGVAAQLTPGAASADVIIARNTMTGGSSVAIYAYGCDGLFIINNRLTGTSNAGVNGIEVPASTGGLTAATRVSIVGNDIRTYLRGIVSGSPSSRIVDNDIQDTGSFGILTIGASMHVRGNRVRDTNNSAGAGAIQIQSGDRSIIVNNEITDTRTGGARTVAVGINFEVSQDRLLVVNNQIWNITTTTYLRNTGFLTNSTTTPNILGP